jgi:hypothetical protein
MDYGSIKKESVRYSRELYREVANKRNDILLQCKNNDAANAFAIDACSELFSIVMASSVSGANGQLIDENFKAVYSKLSNTIAKIVEDTMLENGLQVLRVDVPIEKKEGP